MTNSIYQIDKILGGLWGLIIGDAVGVPYEFKTESQIPPLNKIDMIPSDNFTPSRTKIPFGTYSDDSSQFLCILDSFHECNGFNLENIADKIVDWCENGLWAVDNDVFDIGYQTQEALDAYQNGQSPLKSGFVNEDGKGNGSLMRDLAIPLAYDVSDEELIELSHKQSVITHGHVTNQVCCALYSLVAKYLLSNMNFNDAYNNSLAELKEIYKNNYNSDYLYELEHSILERSNIEYGSGYVVDCLLSAFKAVSESSSYEETIKKSIAFGDDTDTTAAVAGGLAGIIYGFKNIPKKWYSELRGKEPIIDLINFIFDIA